MISSVISVDGNLSESVWNQASSVQFSNAALSDNQVTVKTLWDSTNLYLAYIVQDTSREATNTALWEDDGVEVYVDVANDKSSTMDANDYSVAININNLSSASGISGRTSINSGGYVMEISIPWSYLQTTPSIGKTMGLLLANNDRDNGVSKQFDWLNVIATGNYARPNLWGNLILGASAPADNPLPAPTNVSVK
jgi:oligosaccharide reducing-end xylanase